METCRTSRLLDRDSLVLIVVESVSSERHSASSGCWFSASVAPVALVICKPKRTQALDMYGNPIDLDELRRKVPALDCELGSLASQSSLDLGI